MRRRALMVEKMQQGGGLPSNYTAVEYLANKDTSTIRPYIDTGVVVNQDTKIVVKFLFSSPNADGYFLFGSRTSLNSTDQCTCYIDDASAGNRNLFRFDGSTTATDIGSEKNVIRIVEYSKNGVVKMDADGNILKTATVEKADDFTGTHSLLMWQCWQNGAVSSNTYRSFHGNIYYVKIYDGDTLIRDFVPCLDADGKPCFYDLVGQKPYYNQGNGSFTWG